MYKVYVTNGVTELYVAHIGSLQAAVDKLEQFAIRFPGCTVALRQESDD